MARERMKVVATVVTGLALAALLGATAGAVSAQSTERVNLVRGHNLVGGPLYEDVRPGDFLGCLPATSWRALYLWDAPTQTWKHFFNTNLGIPSYVNRTDLGGIDRIPRASGLYLIMDQPVSNAWPKTDPGCQ